MKSPSHPKALAVPSIHGNRLGPDPSNNPSQPPVTLQMPPVVMVKFQHYLKGINLTGIQEHNYDKDSSKGDRLHLACLLRAFSLRQYIFKAISATLGTLLRGLSSSLA